MLARNAESLYWIGRYVERADDISRILDVTVHQLLEDVTVDPDASSRLLLKVLGFPAPAASETLTLKLVIEMVAYSQSGLGSIADCIKLARENARGAREVTSSELWECLNTTYNGLAEKERSARKMGSHDYLHYVKTAAAMFAGLADVTLSRDDGYRFLVLGRSIERVDMTIRMLLARAGERTSSPAWAMLLRSAGAYDTYLRTYRGALDATRVVEFLLLDRLFPRSVFHSISIAEQSLLELDNRPDSRIGARAEAQLLLGRARSELEFLRPEMALDDLRDRLLKIQDTCREVSEAVTLQYFSVSPYVAWADVRSDDNYVEEAEV